MTMPRQPDAPQSKYLQEVVSMEEGSWREPPPPPKLEEDLQPFGYVSLEPWQEGHGLLAQGKNT